MNWFERWLKQPQRVFLRRALFQVHLWTGILIGLYLVAVSVSGSAIVFRNEIVDKYAPGNIKVAVTGQLLDKPAIKAAAVKLHPGYVVTFVFPKGTDEPTEIWMEGDPKAGKSGQLQWLFNPYTGAGLGNARPDILKWISWMGQLHGNLLMGGDGLWWNGVGGLLLCLVAVSGIVVWWPGVSQWKRALLLRGGVGWKRFNFDLHSMVGFWTMLLVFMWGATGAYFIFPDPVRELINHFTPIDPPRNAQPRNNGSDAPQSPVPTEAAAVVPGPPLPQGKTTALAVLGESSPGALAAPPSPPSDTPRPQRPRRPRVVTTGRKILQAFSYAHYGNFAGWKVKTLWALLGLVPPLLFITGMIMWWNRKVTPLLRRRSARRAIPQEATVVSS